MQLRANEARSKVGALAECLTAVIDGEDGTDREIGIFVVAEAILKYLKSK